MATIVPSAREENLQKSLFWLQQEHAKTLKDLHGEISNLQKRCSGLFTFSVSLIHVRFLITDYYLNWIDKRDLTWNHAIS